MDMRISFWKQLAVSVTRSRRSLSTDLFAWARLRLTLLYVAVGTFMFMVGDLFLNEPDRTPVLTEIANVLRGNTPLHEWTARHIAAYTIFFAFFVAVVYFLAELTLRPIKRAHTEQRRFVANVSHELRTPLSVLKTNSEVALLKGERLTRDDALDVIRGNIEEVNRLSAIIQFFLHFSMLQDRHQRLQMSAVNLYGIARKVVNIIQERAAQKGITIDLVDSENSGATVFGNTTALEEMLLNLVKNAVAYTQSGGSIEIAIRASGRDVLLAVRDSGIGIPPADLPNIFEPFYKGANAAHKKDGVGLGLAIVREIARMHHGKISVTSKIGKGSTFALRLPRFIG